MDQLHKFLKDVSTLVSQQGAALKTPILLSKKEADELVQMRSKVGIFDRWIDRLNQEVGEVLDDVFKVHEGALELAEEMNQHVEVLEKQDEEYREHVKKQKGHKQGAQANSLRTINP